MPMGQIVVRRRDLGFVLTHATVYPQGCHLHLEFVVQRDGAYGRVMGDHPHFRPPLPQTDSDDLHFELRYPDGSVSSTRQLAIAEAVDHVRTRESPQEPLLMDWGGSTTGDHDRVRGNRSVWIYPLPPPQACALTVEWARLAIPPTSIEINGAELTAAAGRAQPFLD